ncbi:hypothetical protein [Nonomuraea angiospora]
MTQAPPGGTIRLLGAAPCEAATRSRIGYLPGEPALEGRERARDYLRLLGRPAGPGFSR